MTEDNDTDVTLMQVSASINLSYLCFEYAGKHAFSEIVAEKLRSLMQQETRGRYRRQDIYDIRLFVEDGVNEDIAEVILSSLIAKSKARDIDDIRYLIHSSSFPWHPPLSPHDSISGYLTQKASFRSSANHGDLSA